MRIIDTILYLEWDEAIMCGIPKGTMDAAKARQSSSFIFLKDPNDKRKVLVAYEPLKDLYKRLVIAKYGDPYETVSKKPIKDLIRTDVAAIQYFETRTLPDGRPIPTDYRRKYANDAAILNAFNALLTDKKKLKQTLNVSLGQFWATAGHLVNDLSRQFPNTLPTSDRWLKAKYRDYVNDGYPTLISTKFCNQNRRKVDDIIEDFILTLHAQHNKPYSKDVWETYTRFIAGQLEIVNKETGEMYSRADYQKDGQPVELSESTIYAYLNCPKNKPKVAKLRTSALEYSSTHRPHIHRHAPVYAFSKITMDDINIPFKLPDGTRVWSYQIFDVASGCVVGVAFGREKNRGLFMAAIRNMFHMIVNNGYGVPAEIEIEQHIANTFKDDLLAQGNVFSFVRFCQGGNPQEKRAEGFIRGKKYQQQNKREGFQRRPFARYEANRLNEDRNDIKYSYEAIVANEQTDIKAWNNSLHPNQVQYAGLTRWQVLSQNQNPNLVQPNIPLLARFIGETTTTSISRNQYVRVQYNKYMLPHANVIGKLNSLDVQAYYIPTEAGLIPEVHLYQDEQYITTCSQLQSFNESLAEQTDLDKAIMAQQFEYIGGYEKQVRTHTQRLAKVKIFEHSTVETPVSEPVSADKVAVKPRKKQPTDYTKAPVPGADYWAQKAINDL